MDLSEVPDRQRFELESDGELVGYIDYIADGNSVVMTHARVLPQFEGRGIGSTMVRSALDRVRNSGRTVVPRCWFVAAYIDRHPEYSDLLAAPRR